MKRMALAGTGLALALTTVAAVRLGGWAVVSVDEPPEYLVVGKAATLSFTVRQHAVSALSGLNTTVTATSGRREVTAKTTRDVGGYRAELTVPEAGDWRVRIESGFGKSSSNLLPIRAITAGSPAPAPLTEAERGKVLFAARACVTCHIHGDVAITGDMRDFGPELTTRRFAVAYLTEFLKNPSIKPSESGKPQMPNPNLRPTDIAPLIAFINSERKTATR